MARKTGIALVVSEPRKQPNIRPASEPSVYLKSQFIQSKTPASNR
jgi:hypothetical protein